MYNVSDQFAAPKRARKEQPAPDSRSVGCDGELIEIHKYEGKYANTVLVYAERSNLSNFNRTLLGNLAHEDKLRSSQQLILHLRDSSDR